MEKRGTKKPDSWGNRGWEFRRIAQVRSFECLYTPCARQWGLVEVAT